MYFAIYIKITIIVKINTFITDINECLNNNGTCSHGCMNMEGGYYCECFIGYALHPNNHDCEGRLYSSVYT